jgi:hypothetical protein
MTTEYYLQPLFPTNILYRDSQDLVNDQILSFSRSLIEQYQGTSFYGRCVSTVTTFNNVLDLEEFVAIKEFLSNLVSVYFDYQKINGTGMKFLDSWLNFYPHGGYQDLHNHHGSLLSGVFWLESSGERDFVFQAPWHFQQPILPEYKELNDINCHNYEINSVAGRGLIFMSHSLHRTLPSSSPSRISLSFNVGPAA